MIRRLFAPLFRLLHRTLLRLTPVDDPWERFNVVPRLHMYGGGSRREFTQYLAGPSGVTVASLEEVEGWLLGCRYESDEALFAEPDFWQHPTTFERLRAGDCEDFALWAWRKLIELDVDADLVVGYCLRDGQLGGRHAWVVFRRDGGEFLFEAVARSTGAMVRPLADAKGEYLPEFGVDRTGRRFAFAGYMIGQKRLLAARNRGVTTQDTVVRQRANRA